MNEMLTHQRDRLQANAARLVASAVAFHDADEAARMLDQAIALMARDRVLGRRLAR